MSSTSALLVQVKQEIAKAYPDFENRATQAWGEVLSQLDAIIKNIIADGPAYLPQVSFSDLVNLKPEQVDAIKRKGSVIIRDVVDDEEAAAWKSSLQEFVTPNPDVETRA